MRVRFGTPSAAVVLSCLLVLLTGCGGTGRVSRDGTTCTGELSGPGPVYLTAWFHTGTPAGARTMRQQVAQFNAAQHEVQVRLTEIPAASYPSVVADAAATGNLPDILGQLYGIGTGDSGLGLFVRPSALRMIGARPPTGVAGAWTVSEFTSILERLRQAGYRRPLDLQMNQARPGGRREWFSYAFAPVVWSAGGDLINRSGYRTAQGVLNSPASVRALSSVQSWFRAGLVNPNRDGTAFARGQAAISWGGSWMYGGYHQVLRLARVNGAIPATRAAISQAPAFAPGGPEQLHVQQLEDGIARARPQTPAYPAITAAFSAAFLDITRGGNVRRALDTAVGQIDRNLVAHRYYQPPEP